MRRLLDHLHTAAGFLLFGILLIGVGGWVFGDFVSDLFEAEATPVKKSRSGICHCPGGRYYANTKTFKPYSTIKSCLDSGGRPPKRGQGDCEKATAVAGSPESMKWTAAEPRKIKPKSSLYRFDGKSSSCTTHRVIDGDTIEIGGKRVRLHGIDTPEAKQSCRDDKDKPYPCGERATSVLGLMAAGGVRCKPAGDEIDRYGRMIATCYSVDGTNINADLVRSGYALAYRKYSKEYVAEEEKARAEKKGMHRGRFIPPWDWRRGKRLQ